MKTALNVKLSCLNVFNVRISVFALFVSILFLLETLLFATRAKKDTSMLMDTVQNLLVVKVPFQIFQNVSLATLKIIFTMIKLAICVNA